MRILIITPYIPYPLSEGGKISQFAAIDSLRASIETHLLLNVTNKKDLDSVSLLKKEWPDVIFHIVLSPILELSLHKKDKKEALKKKILLFLRKIAKTNKKRIFNTYQRETESQSFTTINYAHKKYFIDFSLAIFKKYDFDLVQVEHVPFMNLASVIPNNCKKIFVHHELRFLRLQRANYLEEDGLSFFDKYVIELVKQQELQLLKLYDAVFVFSDNDKIALQNDLKKQIFVAPFPVLDSSFIEINRTNYEKFDKLVFIGPEFHYPNKDAVGWYINEIGKDVFSKTGLVLHVIGDWSQDTMEKYANVDYVKFLGYVEDLSEHFENSIMVVPVRIGSGIRTKILYAMANGVPIVSTSIGCEGLEMTHFENILVANTSFEFKCIIYQLVEDISLCMNIGKAGYKHVKNMYSQSVIAKNRLAIYNLITKQ